LSLLDGSEIRKPRSKKLESLQGVRSLDGKVINGYRSTGTIIISNDNSEVYLYDQDLFSSKEEKYKSDNDYAIKAIKRVHKLKHNITYVLDRGYDSLEYMEQINKLNRKFIVRVSHKNRKVSYLTKPIHTNLPLKPEIKERLATPQVKQTDIAAFPIKSEFYDKIDRLKLKNGTFFNVSVVFRSKEILIADKHEINKNISGTVIEVLLKKNKTQQIYKESMLLFTNQTNLTEGEIREVFYNYLKRFGIEQVFKFLKSTLNLEGFRIHELESIKKIVALTFFAAAYMYLDKKETLENPVFKKELQKLCLLGNSKGEISLVYLQRAIENLFSSILVDRWRKEYNVTDEELLEILRHHGLDQFLESVRF
jgi:Transposase DDE domain